jgi:large subunit ribosomal protein L9
MEIILLEKVKHLGNIGDKAKVKSGYARNFLLPQNKAVLATKESIEKFNSQRAEFEKRAEVALEKAMQRKSTLDKTTFIIKAKVSDEGKLFGSVGIREITTAIQKDGKEISKSEVSLPQGPIHQIGEYEINLQLHTDVTASVKIKIVPEE